MKLKLFVFIFIVYSPYVLSSGIEYLTPVAVGCMPAGICYIVVDPAITKTTCTYKTQLRLDMNLLGSKPQYSAALAAVMAGKKINAFIPDTCDTGNYPLTPGWLHVLK